MRTLHTHEPATAHRPAQLMAKTLLPKRSRKTQKRQTVSHYMLTLQARAQMLKMGRIMIAKEIQKFPKMLLWHASVQFHKKHVLGKRKSILDHMLSHGKDMLASM